MINKKQDRCSSCREKAHDFENEEALNCVPPKETLKFGQYEINNEYRKALYKEFPFYTSEEVVGSYLGSNSSFPSQEVWIERQNENFDDE